MKEKGKMKKLKKRVEKGCVTIIAIARNEREENEERV
jgi:hypothetical protein